MSVDFKNQKKQIHFQVLQSRDTRDIDPNIQWECNLMDWCQFQLQVADAARTTLMYQLKMSNCVITGSNSQSDFQFTLQSTKAWQMIQLIKTTQKNIWELLAQSPN